MKGHICVELTDGAWHYEACEMEARGYWVADRGRHVTSWIRIDKPDNKQYSMDRHHIFYVETVD